MNAQAEAKTKPIDPRDVTFQSHQEAAGLVSMPLIEKQHFDPQYQMGPVAEPPGEVIGKPAVIIPENP